MAGVAYLRWLETDRKAAGGARSQAKDGAGSGVGNGVGAESGAGTAGEERDEVATGRNGCILTGSAGS